MKPFEEDMCRNCSEYEYSDDCKQCEFDWYRKEYKRLLELLERSDNKDCAVTQSEIASPKPDKSGFAQS